MQILNNGQTTQYNSESNQLTRIVDSSIRTVQLTSDTQTIAHVARLSSLDNETFKLMAEMQRIKNV